MKRFTLACVVMLMLTVTAASAQAAKLKDDPNGFNGHTWGKSQREYPALKLVSDLGSTDFGTKVVMYEQPGESLTLNGVTISRITYRFLDDQLESIHVSYQGRQNRDKLMRWIEERHGALSPSERKMITSVRWIGDKTTVDLSYNHATDHGTLLFISRALGQRFHDIDHTSQGD